MHNLLVTFIASWCSTRSPNEIENQNTKDLAMQRTWKNMYEWKHWLLNHSLCQQMLSIQTSLDHIFKKNYKLEKEGENNRILMPKILLPL